MLKSIVKTAALIIVPTIVTPVAVIGAWILVDEVQAWRVLKNQEAKEVTK